MVRWLVCWLIPLRFFKMQLANQLELSARALAAIIVADPSP